MEKSLLLFVFLVSIMVVAGCSDDSIMPSKITNNPQKTGTKIHHLIQTDIKFKIDSLFLKYDIKSSQCKTALLKFYYYQNSDPVMDGEVPWIPINIKIIKNIAQKHDCSVNSLAAVVADYEAWMSTEESVNRNAYEDYGGGAEFDYDQF